jgi:phage terminase Nu1 subunit (DNA packaging protein)
MDTNKPGRKRLSPNEAGVSVKLPADLIEAIDHYAADQYGMGRALAIRELLAVGLYARCWLPHHLEWMIPSSALRWGRAMTKLRPDDDDSWLEGGDADEAASVLLVGLDKRALCAATGFNLGQIRTFVRLGMPATPGKTRRDGLTFDLAAAVQWMVEHHKAPDGESVAGARQRLAQVQAAKIEQQMALQAGELIKIADVRAEISDNLARLRESLLTIPARVATASPELQADIRSEIEAAINLLSFGHENSNGKA